MEGHACAKGAAVSDDEYEGLPPTFAAACRKADAARSKLRPDPRTEQLRRLMESNASLDALWEEVNRAARQRYNAAPQTTVEALLYSLRQRGVWALTEPATKRRLSELSEEQVIEVGDRLQKLKPHIAKAWTADELKALLRARRQ
jgi:transposase